MTELALFPLGVVLLPGGRLPLQIFEPRYLHLLERAAGEPEAFGIILIRSGTDSASANAPMPRLMPVGTSARVVKDEPLPDGRHAVVVEGQRKFRLLSTTQDADFLVRGEIEWLPEEPSQPLPVEHPGLAPVLDQLAAHPGANELSFSDRLDNAGDLANLLGQLLPLDEGQRFELLTQTDPRLRLEWLLDLLTPPA